MKFSIFHKINNKFLLTKNFDNYKWERSDTSINDSILDKKVSSILLRET